MAAPKKPNSTVGRVQDPTMYVSWEENDVGGRTIALQRASQGQAERGIFRATGTNTFQNIAPNNTSVRDSFDKRDYDFFRPGERTPRGTKEMITASMQAYERCGIIYNTVNLMADFAMKGINLVHPNPGIEQWYQNWFNIHVNGADRSERMANLLCRAANVVVRRHTTKLRVKDEERIKKGTASADKEMTALQKLDGKEIPIEYVIMNPLQLEVIGEELAPFLGADAFQYAVKVPTSVIRKIRNPKGPLERQMVAGLPSKIKDALKDGNDLLPLDSDKIQVLYWKRDDWQVWAMPMITPVLDQVVTLKKMELADRAALDGAISHIRIWKLGSLEHRILPTEVAINRLAEILMNTVGGGAMDLIWGPELELTETNTEIYKFLGEAKYAPILTAIYAGLGIPPTLTGSAKGGGGGFTNNFISLKTLTERLDYIRQVIKAFWDYEIRLVQRAMGFRFPATLRFDRMVLTDESAEKALLIQLIDRDIISSETVLERFGELPEIEEVRIRRENNKRDSGKMQPKTGSFHTPDKKHDLQKILLQSGAVAPSELGMELEPKKAGDETALEHQDGLAEKQHKRDVEQADKQHSQTIEQMKHEGNLHQSKLPLEQEKTKQLKIKQQMPAPTVKKGTPGQGRPKNSKDDKKRKQKVVKPRSKAGVAFVEASCWVNTAQEQINQLATPAFLEAKGKKNLRQLTDEEFDNFENFKFAVLCNVKFGQPVDKAAVGQVISQPLTIPGPIHELVTATMKKFVKQEGKMPTVEKVRQIRGTALALFRGDFDEETVYEPDGGQ